MTFEDMSFSVGNERGSRSFAWTDLSKFLETPNFFHLYFDSRPFFLVPKSGFRDKDEIYEFRQMLKEKVS